MSILLKSLIREFIFEAAITTKIARDQKLALFISSNNYFVLYDVNKFKQQLIDDNVNTQGRLNKY